MNMLDQPDNACSLLSKANREPEYNVKTKTLTGYEGPGLPMSGCCTADSPHPGVASITVCWTAQAGRSLFQDVKHPQVPKKLGQLNCGQF